MKNNIAIWAMIIILSCTVMMMQCNITGLEKNVLKHIYLTNEIVDVIIKYHQ